MGKRVFALLLGRESRPVTLWVRDPAKASPFPALARQRTYLPGHPLPESVEVTADLDRVARCRHLILAVPSQALRSVWTHLAPLLVPDHTVVNTAKGIEVETALRLSQVLLQVPSTR